MQHVKADQNTRVRRQCCFITEKKLQKAKLDMNKHFFDHCTKRTSTSRSPSRPTTMPAGYKKVTRIKRPLDMSSQLLLFKDQHLPQTAEEEEDSDFGGDRPEPPVFTIKKTSAHYKEFNQPETIYPKVPVEKRAERKFYVGGRNGSTSSFGEREKTMGINVSEVSPKAAPNMNQKAGSARGHSMLVSE